MDYLSKLPSEVLIEIFQYGQVSYLFLVCKKFNEVISKTPSLMKKMNLLISDKTDTTELMKSDRNHQGILFKFNYKITDSCIELLNTFRGIKSLEFMRCIVPAKLFLEMLAALPSLETISLYTTFLKDVELLVTLKAPNMNKLKNLNFRNSSDKFLIILSGSHLERISVSFSSQYTPRILNEFLQAQRKVRNMLSISVPSIDDSIFTNIMKMTSLKKLNLLIDQLHMDSIRSLELTNTSVTTLNLFGDTNPIRDFRSILSGFKSLKHLEIEMNTLAESLGYIQQFAPDIESLAITHCSGVHVDTLRLHNLKCLSLVDGNYSGDQWIRLAKQIPFLEKLVIKDESITDETFRIICYKFHNLQHLESFYDPQRLSIGILNNICDASFPSNIRFLKITQLVKSNVDFLILNDEHKMILNANSRLKYIFN